jgi:hypothetical protein
MNRDTPSGENVPAAPSNLRVVESAPLRVRSGRNSPLIPRHLEDDEVRIISERQAQSQRSASQQQQAPQPAHRIGGVVHINGIAYGSPHPALFFGPGTSLEGDYQPFVFHINAYDPSTAGGYSPNGPRPGAKKYAVRMSHSIIGDPKRRGLEEGWKRDVVEPEESTTQPSLPAGDKKRTLPICTSCLRPLVLAAPTSKALSVDLTTSYDDTRFQEPPKHLSAAVGRPWALKCGHVVCANCLFAARDRLRDYLRGYRPGPSEDTKLTEGETLEVVDEPILPPAPSPTRGRAKAKRKGKAKGKAKAVEDEGGGGEVSEAEEDGEHREASTGPAETAAMGARKTRSGNRSTVRQRGRPKGKGKKQTLPATPYDLKPAEDPETDWFWTDCPLKDCDGAGTDLLSSDLTGPWEIFV